MIFQSVRVKGRGRGKKIGIPTINLQIPPKFGLEEGIYASWVSYKGKKYQGALHFGPVPVFGDVRRSLEVYLINSEVLVAEGEKVRVEVVKRVREIRNFPTPESMVEQIRQDVLEVKWALKKAP